MKLIFTFAALCFISNSLIAQEEISFTAERFYPEGITFSQGKDLFYVSSVTKGTIGTVNKSGKFNPILTGPGLKSAFGMKVDEKNNKIWFCVADPNYSDYRDSSTFKKMSRLVSIDMNSGKKMDDIDLSKLIPGKHFSNDLTIDDKGNIYITDSFTPAIYKVENGKASIFAKHDLFKGMPIGLNGIVFHKDGFLLVAHNDKGCILKVETGNPNSVTKVKIDQFFPGADGLLLDNDSNLVLVQNKGVNKVFKLTSSDNWKTAKVKEFTPASQSFANPTTCTMAGNDIYVVDSKMNELQDSTKSQSNQFKIIRAKFVAAE